MERRRQARARTLKSARILFNQHHSVIDCTVRNLSPEGACLNVASGAGPHVAICVATFRRPGYLDALLASGYVKSPPAPSQKRRSAAPTDEKIRRLLRRLHLSSSDADLLLGILRQILWKSRSANHPAL